MPSSLAGRHADTTVTADDPVVRDHLVHAVPVLPGVFLLDLVLRVLRRAGVNPAAVELRRCVFVEPVAPGRQGRRIRVVFTEPLEDGGVGVELRSTVVDGDSWVTNCRAQIHPANAALPDPIDVDGMAASASGVTDVGDLYALVRRLDIEHRGFMKATGTVHVAAGGHALARMRLDPAALPYLDEFHLHPVVLDFATLVPLLLLDGPRAATEHAFIPIYIESLRAFGRPARENVVYVPRRTGGGLDADTLDADIQILDTRGRVVATMTGFHAKRIRSHGQITRLADTPVPRTDPTTRTILELVGAKLGKDPADIDRETGFYDLGLDSVGLLDIADSLESKLHRQIYPTLLFDHPTVRSLAEHLGADVDTVRAAVPAAPSVVRSEARRHDLAIVGLAGRYPGAPTAEALWTVLSEGRNQLGPVPEDRWRDDRNRGAFCTGVANFDPEFFHITARQAVMMDPHERLFLQTAWHALEDAGHTPEGLAAELGGAVGVFAGVMWNDYLLHGLEQHRRDGGELAGSWFSALANRVSYTLDFHGPSLTVDTACSSALSALHLAAQSIRRGECRAALVGGVNLTLHEAKYQRLAQLGLLAKDGQSRPFGKDASGYLPGEGVGVVLLRPLADAEAAGDHIYGVLRGSASRHGGRTGGFSVPSPDAEVEVITAALADAGVSADTITLLEAHASGTTLGDRIEVEALTRAYRRHTSEREFCAIGSVKTSIGHLEAAAGIAGLTKLLLCLRHRMIPLVPDIGEVNPDLAFDTTPFYLPRATMPWQSPTDRDTGAVLPRRAALSAFGAGGANVHLIVEEYLPPPRTEREPTGPHVVRLSARTDDRLRESARLLAAHLRDRPDLKLADVAHTLRVGRRELTRKITIRAADTAELVGVLDDFAAGRPCRDLDADLPLADTAGYRVALPTYPFVADRYWIGEDHSGPLSETTYYEPVWTAAAADQTPDFGVVVAFDADAARVSALREHCGRVVQVLGGTTFGQLADDRYQLDPDDPDQHAALVESLRRNGNEPDAILCLPPGGDVAAESTVPTWLFPLCKAWLSGRGRTLSIVACHVGDGARPAAAGTGGLARGLRQENPRIALTSAWFAEPPDAQTMLREAAAKDVEVRHTRAGRTVLEFRPITPTPADLGRDNGVHLITGGLGGLGMHTARRLARHRGTGIALLGRMPAGPASAHAVAELRALGARACYVAADVTDLAALRRAVAEATATLGPLTGVIHAAGVVEDALLPNKSAAAIRRVLGPKTHGVVNLDLATREQPLDYFLLYSSVAAVLGNAGATDYAAANRYLDVFAELRSELALRGERHGRTLSVNLPLWRVGGMRAHPAAERAVLARTGAEPIGTEDGFAALEAAIGHSGHQVVVLHGDRTRLEAGLPLSTEQPGAADQPGPGEPSDIRDYLTGLVSRALNGHAESVETDLAEANFMELGLSSTQLVDLAGRLTADLAAEVPPTVLFRFPNIGALAGYLDREHGPSVTARLTRAVPDRPPGHEVPIAIIGMAGRFPGTGDVDGFWADLVAGRDLISPVPADRWDHSRFYDPSGTRPGTTDCPNGAFLDDVATFDTRFFGIPAAEAASLDPQLRLLLQVLYACAEDAGAAGTLRGSATGTFVGQCYRDYEDEMARHGREPGAFDVVGTSVAMTANRVSHLFDLAGPSLVVDTACSSSLHALHLAVAALRRGECDAAFAAGTNLILSPLHYVRGSAIGALSPSGRCHSFDARADGYVPGESVVAVLLKPLDRALADGDPVHAVIRSTATGHGGHASSVTAPNPERQAEVLARAWEAAAIDPETITYLEAHGTGTALGDPVEVDAVNTAFRRFTDRTGFCALGSAKAHLGHTEGAAGLVGVVKAVLSLRHGVIPVMPEYQQPNRYCALDDSPLFVNTEPLAWPEREGSPRRAGVSSFGFGGAYAHAVLEEPPPRVDAPATQDTFFLPFSAADPSRLKAVLARHRDYLTAHPETRIDHIAATLAHGRERLACRFVAIARSTPELVRLLDVVEPDGQVSAADDVPPDLVSAARRWVDGGTASLPAPTARRISLPTYPFGGERHWFTAHEPPRTATSVDGEGFSSSRVAKGLDRLDDIVRRWCVRLLDDDLLRSVDQERYGRLAAALSDLLQDAPANPLGDEQAELAAVVADYPELSAWGELVRVCLPRLPDVLTGRADVLDVYFSAEHPDLLPAVYGANPLVDHYNGIVARAVVDRTRALREADPERRVRVLEIGGGTGGTTRRVLAALAGDSGVDYTFTDVSNAFLRSARAVFADTDVRLDYRLFDLERDPAAQGFPAGCADIVIAANVVHATRNVDHSLARIRELLTDDGLLLMEEVTKPRACMTALIGPLPGYWSATDGRMPHSPFLDVRGWRAAAERNGFGSLHAISSVDMAESEFDNAVLVCEPARCAARPVLVPAPDEGVLDRLRRNFAAFFGLDEGGIDPDASFESYVDSLSAVEFVRGLEPEFGPLPKVLLYEHRTLASLAAYLAHKVPAKPAPEHTTTDERAEEDPIAIVGMAGRFARSPDLTTWWQHLRDGTDLVTEIPAERFDWREVYGDPFRTSGTVNSRWGSFCEDVDRFDAGFFGVTPVEADLMDPQQRLLLQTAWHAVEDAGHNPAGLRGSRTGVFVGATSHDYDWQLQRADRHREGHVMTGNGHCMIANRISYQLDLRGPSEAIDTACSSSLTALHRAVGSIRAGECDAAIVGGVHLFLTPDVFVALGQLGVMSPDGRCAAFDAKGNGMVRGEGVVAVLVKPLSKALADGDTVHALIRGSGVSHGGQARSLTVPNPAAQAELIESVYREAGVDPRTVGYIEAHGTGTEIGDPIEIRGLRTAFAALTGVPAESAVEPWCGIGTVKSVMGHLEAAAGLTGLVKIVLAMRHGVLPATLHYTEPNPLLDIDGSPFTVVDRLRPWPGTGTTPRRAGVSAFGMGGTNAHVLVEEYPQDRPASAPPGPEIVCLSARSEDRLRAYAEELLDALDSAETTPELPDVAFTLRVGRDALPHRLAVVATTVGELTRSLRRYLDGEAEPHVFTGDAEPGQELGEARDAMDGARLWTRGGPSWGPRSARRPRRLSLPGYPFERERHWVEPARAAQPDVGELLTSLQAGELSVDDVDRLLGGVS